MTIKEQIKDDVVKALYQEHVQAFIKKIIKECEKDVKWYDVFKN